MEKPVLVVLAAGMGSRYGGMKQLDPVGPGGQIIIDYSIFDARRAGFEKVIFIIRKDIEKDFRERLFDRIARNMDADYVFQSLDSLLTSEQLKMATDRKKPWGTIHALLCAKDADHDGKLVERHQFASDRSGRHLGDIHRRQSRSDADSDASQEADNQKRGERIECSCTVSCSGEDKSRYQQE